MQKEEYIHPLISAVVLIASAISVATVYMFYDEDRRVSAYESAQGKYEQTANVFMGLREIENTLKKDIKEE